jgi:hypothetical protein
MISTPKYGMSTSVEGCLTPDSLSSISVVTPNGLLLLQSRILEYDGKSVLFSYEDQISSKTLYVRLTVEEFIARLIRHIPDKGFRQIRYAGIFATRVRSKLIPCVNNILENIRKSANIFMGNLQNYFRERPCCPSCGSEMTLIGISHNGKYIQISQAYASHPP